MKYIHKIMQLVKQKTPRIIVMGILFVGMLTVPMTAYAATDKTAPTVKVKTSTEDPTNQPVKVTIQVTDTSGISKVKYASGTKTAAYFTAKGIALKLSAKGQANVTIKKNGTYTIWAKDKAGNIKIKKITITNIDLIVPTVTITPNVTTPVNTNVVLAITAADAESGIQSVQYLAGEKAVEDFTVTSGAINVTLSTKNKGTVSISKNGNYTFAIKDKAGNIIIQVVKITNIDKIAPSVSAVYSVMNQCATVTVQTSDEISGMSKISYLKGKVTDIASDKWGTTATVVADMSSFSVNKAGNYSILAEDLAGNKAIYNFNIVLELRAMWISYLEFDKSKTYTESQFKTFVDDMFDDCVDLKMNAVIVQVRPMGDAMYESEYFPWSVYASGIPGVSPGYDPLEYMVAAHQRGLAFHAWINPYRVTISGTDVSSLSEDNQARMWRSSTDASNKRNVLSFNSKLYYNPSTTDVQNLVINGVKEIVSNYDVDGIHFDDYFYPSLGTNYKNNFDSAEYVAYVATCAESGTTADSIVVWRRNNVNTLVKKVYASIKKLNPDVQFGISPAGNISNLKSSSSYYVDIDKWLSSSSYVDYICPQIYWSFLNATCPFDETVEKWLNLRTSGTVNMYIGLAAYRAGSNVEPEWDECNDVLKRQVIYGRGTGKVDGYMFFRYESFGKSVTQNEITNLLTVLN